MDKGWRRASKSSYSISFYYRGKRCRERISLIPSAKNDKYVRRQRGEILNQIERGTFNYSEWFPNSKNAQRLASLLGQAISVEQLLDGWLDRIKPEVEKSTYYDYKKSVLYSLAPKFGGHMITELTKSEVRVWIGGLGVSKKRAANLLTPLRQAYADALDDGLIDRDPFIDWRIRRKKSKSEVRRESADPFTPDEITAILDAATDPLVYNMISFWLWTGLRTSELFALEWVDIVDDMIHVRSAYVLGETKGPKTAAGKRAVRILSPAKAALDAQKPHTWFKGEHVWVSPSLKQWKDAGYFQKRYWTPLLRRAGVRYRKPYQCRHTYASTLLSAGENVHWVARQMGHADATMVLRTYGKWIPEIDPQAGDKVEKNVAQMLPKQRGN